MTASKPEARVPWRTRMPDEVAQRAMRGGATRDPDWYAGRPKYSDPPPRLNGFTAEEQQAFRQMVRKLGAERRRKRQERFKQWWQRLHNRVKLALYIWK